MKKSLASINEHFRKNSADIAAANWHLMRWLSWIYLCCLLVYYWAVAMPQGIALQRTATVAAAAVQVLFIICVLSVKKDRVTPRLSYVYLSLFAALIAAFATFLGTVVFRDDNALLFPLLLIMLVQFYTLPPQMILPLLAGAVIVFLAASFYFKPLEIFSLDILSTVVAQAIALVSYYTAITAKAEEALKRDELQYLSAHDPLTGLLNRAAFTRMFEETVAHMGGTQYALAITDLDKFKTINDIKGHIAGDRILIGVAKAMKESFNAGRDGLTVGRFGGDEFIALLVAENGAEDIRASAQRLFDLVDEVGRQESLPIACSVGVVTSSDTTKGLEALLTYADEALYAAKRKGGRNCEVRTV